HVTTATTMMKFMRELFGERPEPWSDLEAREEIDNPITLTAESLASGSAVVAPMIGSGSGPQAAKAAEDALEARLHATPAVTDEPLPSSPSIAAPTIPYTPSTPPPAVPPPWRRVPVSAIAIVGLAAVAAILLAVPAPP